ncbi:hypothetical protein FOL47_007942 [Perkinsus chesapeaki]|uniref:C3H1-type domain-containing protein n=1 Tax=Perkinsus chesapeaki TaxID=330153 RepID=A0A7J6MUY7_PERCH|nr:hypothetical protein FOL47_007942 [Perkinsus chesapeaki]|mmetsp:Transcript_20414/g.17443  ORF Transcript_20414/g.17443 Transcript_20414/m.17443 type:complete len:215 (-) Transcript_20414:216-860(-)
MSPPTNRNNAERLRKRYKVRMCIYYLAGGCTEGENCTFAHSPEELANPKTVMCPSGARCTDRNCPFAHDKSELVVGHQRVIQQMCKYIGPGFRGCNAGDCCRFAHTRDELLTGVRDQASNLLGDAGMVGPSARVNTDARAPSTSQLTPEHAHPDLITKDRVREAAKSLGLGSHNGVGATTNENGEIVWQLTTDQLLNLIEIASGGRLSVDTSSA